MKTMTKAEKEMWEAFEQSTRSLIEWLNNHGHPHMTVIVTSVSAELVEGVRAYRTEEYLKD